MRVLASIVMGLVVSALGACSSVRPLSYEQMNEPALREIYVALIHAVEKAKEDPHEHWRSGWWGNILTNTLGGDNYGLCWQWRDKVWEGVKDAVTRARWSGTGIGVNVGHSAEHHAVLVFDPRRVPRDNLLTQPTPRHGYVLDAWRHGEPEVYRLDDWIEMPVFKQSPAELRELVGEEHEAERSDRTLGLTNEPARP